MGHMWDFAHCVPGFCSKINFVYSERFYYFIITIIISCTYTMKYDLFPLSSSPLRYYHWNYQELINEPWWLVFHCCFQHFSIDSGFQGQFLNPKVLNKALLHSNNTNFPSSQRYELPFFQNRIHESDAKFHLPWNKLCDSMTLPGIFFCLYSTWTRKIPIPITNYWTDGLKKAPLTQ